MQSNRLGRWVVRVACAIGVGAAVLSGPVAANAASLSSAGGALHGTVGQLSPLAGKDSSVPNMPSDVIWS